VQKAIDEYRNQNDWFTHFLEDKCEVDSTYREGSNTLYQAYRNYCQDTNEYVRSTTDFYFALEKAGFTKLNLSGRKMIKGLRLKVDDGDFEDFLQ
jgi:phage/plasmid-associated DNA primase